ncbi:hypothetical protein [Streptomyces sp. I05A-00742]|uniref:hypothetical protein n=1 Tax=Streptomyces sp. I05A-00742 TaxID=2732853 RepID=UPI001487B00B|nr:hypothetical protein [Streptomyces sp. I05A-00742]
MVEQQCGERFESYFGTYKGTYKAEPVRDAHGRTQWDMARAYMTSKADSLSRAVFGSKGSAGDGGSILADALLGSAQAAATESFDVTARFYMDERWQRLVEVTTLKHEPGAKPYTDVCGFGLNLRNKPARAEFHARTQESRIHYSNSDPDKYVDDYNKHKQSESTARAIRHLIDFSLSAMDCRPGTDVPQRLYENVVKNGVKIVTELHREQ